MTENEGWRERLLNGLSSFQFNVDLETDIRAAIEAYDDAQKKISEWIDDRDRWIERYKKVKDEIEDQFLAHEKEIEKLKNELENQCFMHAEEIERLKAENKRMSDEIGNFGLGVR